MSGTVIRRTTGGRGWNTCRWNGTCSGCGADDDYGRPLLVQLAEDRVPRALEEHDPDQVHHLSHLGEVLQEQEHAVDQ